MQLSGVQRTDLALALAALWLGRLSDRMDYAAGFIFMVDWARQRAAPGPVLNVLPLGIILRRPNAAGTGNPTGGSTEKNASSSNDPMPNKLSVTAGERQVMNRCLVRYQYQGI
ncbi:hypothetical protein ACNKHW_03250 [Shigella flexneri]